MAIRGKIGTKITINPIYMTNRRCPGSFGKFEDLVANPGDLTNLAPIKKNVPYNDYTPSNCLHGFKWLKTTLLSQDAQDLKPPLVLQAQVLLGKTKNRIYITQQQLTKYIPQKGFCKKYLF